MSNYVPPVAPMSKRAIEEEATKLVRTHYPHVLREPTEFPVLEFFDHVLREDYQLDTGVDELSDGVEGMTWPDGRVMVSEETYRGAAIGIPRCRFTVVHESYHGLKHVRQIRKALVDSGELVLYRRTTIEAYRDPEWQANYFAGAILMPATMVKRMAAGEGRLILPIAMAEVFTVSVAAANVRLQKLRISSEKESRTAGRG